MILQGTPPFMSHQILCDPDNHHTVADDLESFFYILLYITMMFGGPGQSKKKENIPYFIHSWLYEPEMRKIGLKKYAICSNSPQVFSSQFLVHVQDYFKEFIPCLERLHLIFHLYVTSDYDSKYEPMHEMFLKVFHETKAMAPFTKPEGPENKVNIKKSCLTSLGGCADIPNLVVEPSMGPLRDLVFMAHTAAPFSFVLPHTDMSCLLCVSHTSFPREQLPGLE